MTENKKKRAESFESGFKSLRFLYHPNIGNAEKEERKI